MITAKGHGARPEPCRPRSRGGLVDGYRKKAPAFQFFLARVDGVDCAYGAGVLVPNGMGIVEDLFTLPAFRKRGIATSLIARAIAHVRGQGAGRILIGAHATAEAKRLYAALGFAPVCITREYIKRLGPDQNQPGSAADPRAARSASGRARS